MFISNVRTPRRRMHALVGDEADADSAFWNQKAFQEDEEDKNYKFVDQEDIVDSDIDLSEGEEEEAEEVVPEKRKRSSRAYREPASIRALKKRMKGGAASQKFKRRRVSRIQGEKMTLRTSTQRHTETIAKKQATSKKRPAKSGVAKTDVAPRLTQEEMLVHALITEQQNKQSLKRSLEASLDEKKRKAPSAKFFGPTIRYHSRKTPRLHVMSFTDVTKVPAVINSTQCKYKKRQKTCVITGLPAKYRDPVTGYVYANLEAFREIRRRYGGSEKEEEEEENETSGHQASPIRPITPIAAKSN
jgi:vacuolar protein sorting-associated protein 72